MASALGVPHIAAFTDDFPAGIRAYPNTVSTRDMDLPSLLQKATALYTAPQGPKSFGSERVDLLSEKYAYGRTLELGSPIEGGNYDLIRLSGLLENEDWRQQLWDYSERLSPGGTIFMYERYGSFDPLLLTKYLMLTAGLNVVEYTATPDAYGHFFVAAQKTGATLYRLFREEYIDAATFIEDFPPEIPTSEPEPEPPRHRFIASTIVRPPNIHKVSDEDSEEKP
jgi:hypothetical protein